MGINGVVNKPIGFFSFAFFRPKGIKGAKWKECRNCWVDFFFWVDLSLWHGFLTVFFFEFHWWMVWVREQLLCWDNFITFAGFQRIFQKRGRYEEKRGWGSSNVVSSLQCFWKSEGDAKRIEGEKKYFFIICWCARSRLVGAQYAFYASSWPNLIS